MSEHLVNPFRNYQPPHEDEMYTPYGMRAIGESVKTRLAQRHADELTDEDMNALFTGTPREFTWDIALLEPFIIADSEYEAVMIARDMTMQCLALKIVQYMQWDTAQPFPWDEVPDFDPLPTVIEGSSLVCIEVVRSE